MDGDDDDDDNIDGIDTLAGAKDTVDDTAKGATG